MRHNPYQPPSVGLSAQKEIAPRPIAVWLFQLLGCAVVLGFFIGMARFAGRISSNPAGLQDHMLSLVIAILLRIAIVALVVAILVQVHRGRMIGRWIGVVAIFAIIILSLFGQDTTQYSNDAQRAGGAFGRMVLLPALLATWIYAFGFSRKAKRYFGVDVKTT